MRLGVLVAILGEMPELRDKTCLPRERRPQEQTKKEPKAAHRAPVNRK